MTIDVEQFVAQDDIDPILFDHPYWLLPAGEGDGPLRAYRLLVDTLNKAATRWASGGSCCATASSSSRCANAMACWSLTTMRFADEVRDPQNTGAIPGGEATARRSKRSRMPSRSSRR